MLVTVPQVGARFPYDPLTGLNGLGQDDTIVDPDTGNVYDLSTGTLVSTPSAGNVSGSLLNVQNPYAGLVTPVTTTDLGTSPAPGNVSGSYMNADQVSTGGYATSASGDILTTPATQVFSASQLQSAVSAPTAPALAQVVTQGTGSGLTAAQIQQIFSNAAASGLAIFKATSSPALIPGTSLVYNPATGQVTNSLGLTSAQLASTLTTGSMSITTVLLLGAVVLVAIMMSKGR